MRPTPKTADQSPCNPTTISYAWIDPEGGLHLAKNGHVFWAWERISKEPELKEGLPEKLSPDNVLLRRGWIRVSNFTAIEVWKEREVSDRAWRAVSDLILSCCISRRDIDPFEPFIVLESTSGGFDTYSPSDFLDKFAGRRKSEELFEKLMARTANVGKADVERVLSRTNRSPDPKRVASRHLDIFKA